MGACGRALRVAAGPNVVLGLHAVGLNAVAGARVACHNNQADSPRTDFKLNDDFGGIVTRIPLN